jgi:Fe2+ or Zn2+ uptake regulation protein
MTNHPTADEVYEKVQVLCPIISKGTVYRDLNRLADNGEILRIAVANAPDRYDLTRGRHTHCRCEVCGRVFDYHLRVEPELDAEGNANFHAENFDIVVNGVCRDCLSQRRT